MKNITALTTKPAALALAAVLATTPLVVNAATSTPSKTETGTINITEYTNWGDPAMAGIAVDSGRALIDHLRTASALLSTGKTDEARGALIASREFADAIERIMPYLTVVADMRDASNKLVEEDVAIYTPDMLPIYASLDELQVYAPKVASRNRARVKHAEKYAASGNREVAAQKMREAADDIVQHTVYLPVTYVDEQVRGALYALDQAQPDVTNARAAVDRALKSVTTVVDEVVTTARS